MQGGRRTRSEAEDRYAAAEAGQEAEAVEGEVEAEA